MHIFYVIILLSNYTLKQGGEPMKTQDRDVKKRRRAALSKMAILLAFTVLVWLFLTIDSHTF